MKVTIIPSDGVVYLDGAGYRVASVSALAQSIHAIQWDGTKGHVEYVQHEDYFTPNMELSNIDAYNQYVQEAIVLAANPPVDAPIPLDVYTFRKRQQIAFGFALTEHFGVQYADPQSIGMLTAMVALFDKGLLTGTVNYKGPNGFITLDQTEMTMLSGEVAAWVQKAFNAEKSILEKITMQQITTYQQIDAAFKAAMEA